MPFSIRPLFAPFRLPSFPAKDTPKQPGHPSLAYYTSLNLDVVFLTKCITPNKKELETKVEGILRCFAAASAPDTEMWPAAIHRGIPGEIYYMVL